MHPQLVSCVSHHYFHLFQNTSGHDDVSMHIRQTKGQLLPASLHPSPTAGTKAPSWNILQVESGSTQIQFIFSLSPCFGRILPLESQLPLLMHIFITPRDPHNKILNSPVRVIALRLRLLQHSACFLGSLLSHSFGT